MILAHHSSNCMILNNKKYSSQIFTLISNYYKLLVVDLRKLFLNIKINTVVPALPFCMGLWDTMRIKATVIPLVL
jgi:hypothetical protein